MPSLKQAKGHKGRKKAVDLFLAITGEDIYGVVQMEIFPVFV